MSGNRLVAALAAVFVLAGCGGGGGGKDSTNPTSWQDKVGCTSVTEEETEELFVLALYTCTKSNGEQTSVYTFKDTAARDHWREIAEQVGTVVLNDGSTWLESK